MNFSDFQDSLSVIVNILNSSFVSSAAGALLGAYFGAHAATKFAENKESRRLQAEQFQKVVSCINLASTICNHSLGPKDQVVRELVDTYFATDNVILKV